MRLLDLYCGAGGAAMGYHRAGFEVVGVDIAPQPSYPFEFHRADALVVALDGFDLIHASPPCQRYSRLKRHAWIRPNLLGLTRQRLQRQGTPYLIENVAGAPMVAPVQLCGTYFELPIRRHRLFECSERGIRGTPCRHELFTEPKYPTQDRKQRKYGYLSTVVQAYGHTTGWHLWEEAMGIDWMRNRDELAEAIPPAYTEWLGVQLMSRLQTAVVNGRGAA